MSKPQKIQRNSFFAGCHLAATLVVSTSCLLVSAFVVDYFWTNDLSAESPTSQTKIGVILPLTGDAAAFGAAIKSGILSGASSDLELHFEDEACESAAAVKAYRSLRKQKIKLFIGPFCGGSQRAVGALAKEDEVVEILGSPASETIAANIDVPIHNGTGEESQKGIVISVAPSIESEARFLAAEIDRRFAGTKRTKVLIGHGGNDFGLDYEIAFTEAFHGEVVDSFTMNSVDSAGLRSFAARILKLKPDAVLVPDALPFLTGLPEALVEANLQRVPIYSIHTVQLPNILNVLKANPILLAYSYPTSGQEEVLTIFPRRAAELASKLAKTCAGELSCFQTKLLEITSSNSKDFLPTDFVLKQPS